MKLKGNVTIKVTDDKTGRVVFKEEHSNAITPALQRIFENNIAGTVDFTKVTPILDKLLGGVCLWNGSLDETSIFLPKRTDAVLIAHAGQNVYSSASDDPTRGNPNTEAEGYGPVENGFRWVWEWPSSQGAGQITGLTLCHADVGDYYNQLNRTGGLQLEPVEDISNYIINANDITYSDAMPAANELPKVVGFPGLKGIPLGFYNDLNHVVSIETVEDEIGTGEFGGQARDGHINIYISKFTGTGLWLWNNIGDTVIEEEKTITVENGILWQAGTRNWDERCKFYVAYDETNKHIYFLQAYHQQYQDWDPLPTPPFVFTAYPASETLHIIDVDIETGSVTKRTATLPVGGNRNKAVFRAPLEHYGPIPLHIVDGCVLLPVFVCEWIDTSGQTGQAGTGYYNWDWVSRTATFGARVNLRTGTIMDYVPGRIGDCSGGNAESWTGYLDLGNERTMFPDIYIEKRAAAETFNDSAVPLGELQTLFCSDLVPRTVQVFGTDWRANRTFAASTANSLVQFITNYRTGSGNRLRGAVLNKMYQASVFRLTQAVTKTIAQTMTVEYTITQEEEE